MPIVSGFIFLQIEFSEVTIWQRKGTGEFFMPNEFLTVKNIARAVLPRLIENLVFPNLVYKDYSEAYELGRGATIRVRKPVTLTARDFDETLGTSPENIHEESVDVTLDKLATVDAEFGAVARATSVDDLNRLFVEPAAAALAEKINADGLSLYKDIPYFVGTAGTTPDGLDDFANAAKLLDQHKVPASHRFGVWDIDAMAKFRQLGDIVNAEKSGATAALRAGSIGNIYGISNFMSQGVVNHTAGTGSSATISVGAAASAGDSTIKLKGAAAFTLKKGDLLTIAGKQYVVTADANVGTTSTDVTVYPALAADLATTDTVTACAGGAQNLVFHENAFAFVTRPLAAPAGVESYSTSYNGITLRITRGYDMKYKKETISADVLYGFKTMYPELAVRVLG